MASCGEYYLSLLFNIQKENIHKKIKVCVDPYNQTQPTTKAMVVSTLYINDTFIHVNDCDKMCFILNDPNLC